jgi:putative transcriptional regulator
LQSAFHPSAAFLARYAYGDAPLAVGLTLSAHLESCSACRSQVDSFEEGEGRRLEALDPAPLNPDALETALRRLKSVDLAPSAAKAVVDHLGDVRLPAAVARLGRPSRRFVAPGMWAAPIRAARTDDWRAFILRAPAGVVIPTHGHRGGELIAVLAGAFRDGETYRAGDYLEGVPAADHRLRVTSDGPCVCLVAVQGRIQWRGWARVLTPMLGL